MSISQSNTELPVNNSVRPEVDFSQENATYEREKEWLERNHIGEYVVIHGSELAGVFRTPGEAIRQGLSRFGLVPTMVKEIRDPREPLDFIGIIDLSDPSFQSAD